jgi:hypothetical protein
MVYRSICTDGAHHQSTEELIGVPIHTDMKFQVPKIAVEVQFGSNGEEVGQPAETTDGRDY